MRQNEKNPSGLSELEGKYLTFTLADEDYGLEIMKVREIIGLMEITAVPQTPPYVKGVINLRGKVIPVLDLRLRFGMPERAYDERTCIIVVEIREGDEKVHVGVVVDTVSEVLNIAGEDIEPPPGLGMHVMAGAILGMAKVKDRVKILLNIEEILKDEGWNLLAEAEPAAAEA
ncbi:purine-binding chemotaxis protein CheW [Dissulfurirhabdus thermomarina]|uniref:Chemotaxis protein CheW n=1 Tax=Dissulfurirhabdus thermomarina TaxID=1765737 RepID=A0A6N9TLQ8_DISTH|nr:chemotaxis protein CheW [Dissulfurirhabdus thermomarina]NDY41978.1 purine-binding chemotaxis protein CheW [Dissulfurirhabdus thermomarina]NMX22799.1 purine-binding chemotaxis protein CheW [Dissulfurirhabdus thermomarina]